MEILDNKKDLEDIAIRVDNVTKSFKIYDKPQDRLKDLIYPQLKKLIRRPNKKYYREFTALKDISFNIKKGETVGIIGRNGSGKSTLLQIICGTLAPTTGEIKTNGRIAALLELGSGFNPEFTGRENIYMSCAILGLTKKQVDGKFEDIASFADIGDFIEQPVKTYSSGMFVRLAFAVNIMSQPEIMVVDEALAVGDMKFQAKCMTALKRIQEKGTTILFVSHDIGSVKGLCEKAIFLENGKIFKYGKAGDVAELYVRRMREEMNQEYSRIISDDSSEIKKNAVIPAKKSEILFKESKEFDFRVASFRYGTGEAKITYIELLDQFGNSVENVEFDQEVLIKIYFRSNTNKTISVNYYIVDEKKVYILGAGQRQLGLDWINAKENDKFIFTYKTRLPLHEGNYSIQFQLTEPVISNQTASFLDVIEDAAIFKVNPRLPTRIWAKVYIPNHLDINFF